MKSQAIFAFAVALALPTAAQAQAYQCRMGAVTSVPVVKPDGPIRELPISGYTLALSWSPEFCKPREDAPSHRAQCSGDNGRFGLVVHGLWPQSQSGGRATWPQWCKSSAQLTPTLVRQNMCMMPSARLIARQWGKHGTCMSKRPETYLKVTRILWQGLRIPDYDAISREDDLTAGRIRRALADANPGWGTRAIGVKLNERGWLQEIRMCYDRTFHPARCDARRFGAKDSAGAKIWRGL